MSSLRLPYYTLSPAAYRALAAAETAVEASPLGKQLVRLVTHLDFSDDMLEQTLKALRNFDAPAN